MGGKTFQIAASVTLCEQLRSRPDVYEDVMCCDTDYCNAIGNQSRPTLKSPTVCYTNVMTENGEVVEHQIPAIRTMRCASYEYFGKTVQLPADIKMCQDMKSQ